MQKGVTVELQLSHVTFQLLLPSWAHIKYHNRTRATFIISNLPPCIAFLGTVQLQLIMDRYTCTNR